MDKKKSKLPTVSDEEDLRRIPTLNLASEGYQVSIAANIEETLEMSLEEYHLLVLDAMMSGMNGFKFAELIRRDEKLTTSIIFLTVKGTENGLLIGFNIGADNYMTKPFSIEELQTHIQAIPMRFLQSGLDFGESQIKIGTLLIDLDAKQAFVHGGLIELTKKELEILALLARGPGKVFSRKEVLDRVWREDVFVLGHTIDIRITHIHKELRNGGIKIINRSGFDYYLIEEGPQQSCAYTIYRPIMSQHSYKSKVFVFITLLFILPGGIIYFIQCAPEKEIKTRAPKEYLEQTTDCVNNYIIDYATHPRKRQSDTLPNPSHLPDPQALGHFLAYLLNRLRFIIINLRGDVYFDNFAQGPIPENHLSCVELQQASLHNTDTSRRHNETLGEGFHCSAKEYQDQGYYIRVAIPYRIDYINCFRSNHFFLLLIVGISSLALLIAVSFTDQLSRSVRELHDFVTKAQAGGEHESVTFPKSEVGELGERLKKTFKMLEGSKTRYEVEREKSIQHFASFDAGIPSFSAEHKFICANSHLMQNLNTPVDTPTFTIDGRILDYPEFYQVKALLAGTGSDSDTAPRSIRYIIDRDGSHLEVRT